MHRKAVHSPQQVQQPPVCYDAFTCHGSRIIAQVAPQEVSLLKPALWTALRMMMVVLEGAKADCASCYVPGMQPYTSKHYSLLSALSLMDLLIGCITQRCRVPESGTPMAWDVSRSPQPRQSECCIWVGITAIHLRPVPAAASWVAQLQCTLRPSDHC